LNTHISAAMRAFIEAHPDWLTEARLPAYAPDLNAVEGAWANMKNGLGNLAATTWTSSPRSSRTGSRASSTGPLSSMGSLPKPGSLSNQNRRRPQPFKPL
jgi:transposase